MNLQNVPVQFDELVAVNGYWIGGMVIAIFLLVALAFSQNRSAVISAWEGSILPWNNKYVELKSSSGAKLFLVLSAIGGVFLCTYLTLFYNSNDAIDSSSMVVFVPLVGILLALIFFPVFSVLLVFILTGEKKILATGMPNQLVWLSGAAIPVAFIALFFGLYPRFGELLSVIFLVLMAFFQVVRLLRLITGAIQSGYAWYYIILYFCTLEILPMALIGYVIWMNFGVL